MITPSDRQDSEHVDPYEAFDEGQIMLETLEKFLREQQEGGAQ
jgi:hypothetical protein